MKLNDLTLTEACGIYLVAVRFTSLVHDQFTDDTTKEERMRIHEENKHWFPQYKKIEDKLISVIGKKMFEIDELKELYDCGKTSGS